jgi:DNA-binding NarL/FixJ family response regulator
LLIVDDHAVVRLGVRNMIAANRPEWQICGEAEDGAKAVAKVLELTPDAVILDLAMPVMNGIEAAKRIRRLAPSTKIVLFSVHDVPASVWENCADAFVSKLSTVDELAVVIEQLTRPAVRTAKKS